MVGYGLLLLVMMMFVVLCLTVSQMAAISAHTSHSVLKRLQYLREIYPGFDLYNRFFLCMEATFMR